MDEPDVEGMRKLLSRPLFFPEEFKTWLQDYVSVNIPMIPYSHVFGSRINIARSGNYVAASESTTSTSYTDLATVGPLLTNLANGTYLIGYGANNRAYASLSVNGATPLDADGIHCHEIVSAGARWSLQSMNSNNQNTVKVQYKSGWAHSKRWLVAMRVGPA
jgi:hypothetical protein